MSLKNCHETIYMNVGSGVDITIKQLAETIGEIMDFSGDIRYDTSKPNGQMIRRLDCTKIYNAIGWKPTTLLKDGLISTIQDFKENVSRLY